MDRRNFLTTGLAAAAAAGINTEGAEPPIPIIDCHIHLFDPGRKQGVPWPPKENSVLYKPAMPGRYKKLAAPLGVVGAIEVECSPWVEDNQWVLDVIEKDSTLLGTVGNIEPGKPDFPAHLERLAKNKRFLGIRYGTLWDRPFHEAVKRPEVVADIKRLAAAKLTMDSATASPALILSLLRVKDAVPDLKIVIDHLPQLEPPVDAVARKAYDASLREIAGRPGVWVKISEVLRRVNGRVPQDLEFYRPRLDELFGIFGEDRVLYGSDWPNSDNWAEYPAMLRVVKPYFESKGRTVAEKYFWRNSLAAYGWTKRTSSQPAA